MVPRELRLVVFDRHEVAASLRDVLISRRQIEAVDQIEIIEITPDPAPAVSIVVIRGTARTKHLLRGPLLAAAMISFCLRQRIPLPHRTAKSLRVMDDGLALSFSQGIDPNDFDLILRRKPALSD